MRSESRTILVLLGPTGVGKSRTSLKLALKFGGEIINCDSMQVYRGFDIGTDKPPTHDRKAVPHHLLDLVDPEVQFTAADFVAGALGAIRDIRRRKRLPIVVGGTGLYVRALLEGLFPGPGRNPEIRRRLEDEAAGEGLENLFRRLETIDPDYARTIRGRDRVRIIRALEVHEVSGKTMSEHFPATESFVKEFQTVKIGLDLDRKDLYSRIEDRVDRMFEAGLPAEVERLIGRGVREDAPPFKALGYKWVLKSLKGEINLEEAKARTKLDTRHYAKRQMTWFRKMEGIVWFSPEDYAALEEYVAKNIQ
ncbi:MAG: tRNA (adenosine(37)-N6)-dimethylallyltransferase MiaA [Candidatus Aminicenantales bacterium]